MQVQRLLRHGSANKQQEKPSRQGSEMPQANPTFNPDSAKARSRLTPRYAFKARSRRPFSTQFM